MKTTSKFLRIFRQRERPQVYNWDIGTTTIRAGWSGHKSPRALHTNVLGTPTNPNLMSSGRSTYIGDSAQQSRGILSLHYPMVHGIVSDWDSMETIIHHVLFDELRSSPNLPLFLSEPVLNPACNREIFGEVFFEKFGFPQLYMSLHPILALYGSGRTTGLIVNSGGGVTSVTAIFEGTIISRATNRMYYGGNEITQYLMDLLNQNQEKTGISFSSSTDFEVVKQIKEENHFIETSYNPLKRPPFLLPDGNSIVAEKIYDSVVEPLFDPSLIGNNGMGIVSAILDTIDKCPTDSRTSLLSNIILEGGNTFFSGFSDRITEKLVPVVPVKVRVISPPERKYSVWIGGGILSSMELDWLSREMYDEFGPKIMHRTV